MTDATDVTARERSSWGERILRFVAGYMLADALGFLILVIVALLLYLI